MLAASGFVWRVSESTSPISDASLPSMSLRTHASSPSSTGAMQSARCRIVYGNNISWLYGICVHRCLQEPDMVRLVLRSALLRHVMQCSFTDASEEKVSHL